MKFIEILSTALFLAVIVTACRKKDNQEPSSVQLQYENLSAQSTTVAVNSTVKITVTASGNGLTYNWSASEGTIIGSGYQITYGSPCCAGTATVSCEVKDSGGKSETKSVTITIQ